MKSRDKMGRLMAFTYDFISFLMEKIDIASIDSIILFGSLARNEATKDSDIDLFIDTRDNALEGEIEKLNEQFYASKRYKEYWELLGVENKINCMVGKLDEWKLKRSIISEGKVLYGKFIAKIEGKPFTLFIVEVKGKSSVKLHLWRNLYGYHQKIGKKVYFKKGLVIENNGKKLAPGIFVVPLPAAQNAISFLRKNRVKHKLIELWTDML